MTEKELLDKQAELVRFLQGAGTPISRALTQIAQFALNYANDGISGQDMKNEINKLSISTMREIQNAQVS